MKRTNGNSLAWFFAAAAICGSAWGAADQAKDLQGTSTIQNDKGEVIAKGKLVVVDGCMAIPGVKGANFIPISKFTGTPRVIKGDGKHDKTATIRVGEDDRFTLEDDNFFFVYDASYGILPDENSSFARNTRFLLPPKKTFRFWDSIVATGDAPGEVSFRYGKMVDKKNVTIKKAADEKQKTPAEK